MENQVEADGCVACGTAAKGCWPLAAAAMYCSDQASVCGRACRCCVRAWGGAGSWNYHSSVTSHAHSHGGHTTVRALRSCIRLTTDAVPPLTVCTRACSNTRSPPRPRRRRLAPTRRSPPCCAAPPSTRRCPDPAPMPPRRSHRTSACMPRATTPRGAGCTSPRCMTCGPRCRAPRRSCASVAASAVTRAVECCARRSRWCRWRPCMAGRRCARCPPLCTRYDGALAQRRLHYS